MCKIQWRDAQDSDPGTTRHIGTHTAQLIISTTVFNITLFYSFEVIFNKKIFELWLFKHFLHLHESKSCHHAFSSCLFIFFLYMFIFFIHDLFIYLFIGPFDVERLDRNAWVTLNGAKKKNRIRFISISYIFPKPVFYGQCLTFWFIRCLNHEYFWSHVHSHVMCLFYPSK